MIISNMYHGTAEHITRFDPDRTGCGIDQLGSGFYFDSVKGHAEFYAYNSVTEGRGTCPNIICASIELHNPIELSDKGNDLDDIPVSAPQAIAILQQIPQMYHLAPEESIMGDFLPEIWQKPPANDCDIKFYIRRLVHQYFNGTTLRQLDFLCAKWPTEFRTAVHETLGYDGVIVHYPHSMQAVAWFPDQIQITNTIHLKSSKEDTL